MPKYSWLLLTALVVTCIISIGYLTLDVMEVDTAQYASIAWEMVEGGEWLQVQHQHKDYLDKPPLLFWMSGLSFLIFGISNFSFKLPALVMALVGAYSTYRFTRLFYSEQAARWAGFMLLTCQAGFLLINNVLTDSLLVGSVALATWSLVEYIQSQRWKWLLAAGVALGLAMLAKGPIGLMVPVLAFGTHWVLKKQWHWFYHWKWLVLVGVVALVLAPMVYGLYQQHGSYGPYFYFWEQSFGRLTGQNAFIQSMQQPQPYDPTFFIHTFVWSFLPWSLVGITALVAVIYHAVRRRWQIPEFLSIGGLLLPAIALSFSDYMLPHYLYVTFPFAAMLVAGYIQRLVEQGLFKTIRALRWVQWVLSGILITAAIALVTYFFPGAEWWVWLGVVGLIVLTVLVARLSNQWMRLLGVPLFAILLVNWVLAFQVYPDIFSYQARAKAGQWKTSHDIPDQQFTTLHRPGHALDFYARMIVYPLGSDKILSKADRLDKPVYVFTDASGVAELEQHVEVDTMEEFKDYRVAFLKWEFINPATRGEEVEDRYLVKIEKN